MNSQTTARQWQPIETAPKDGERILGAFKDYPVMGMFWSFDHWKSDDGQVMFPIGWQPLPEPPK
jgi:hypothetical protein